MGHADQRIKLAVFASGGGSNFQAIIDACEAGSLPLDIVLCLSNKESAGALDRARRHGIPAAVRMPHQYADEALYVAALQSVLRHHDVNFVALAGYMKKVPSGIVRAYHNRMLNIHPALLPAFGGRGMYGRHVHEAALAYGVRWTGATVHLVDEAYDTGPVVLQEPVPVAADDTPETLAARVLETEHRLFPEALRLFARGRVSVDGRMVRIAGRTSFTN